MLNTELPVLFPKWYKEVGALQGAEVVRAELLSRDKMEAYTRSHSLLLGKCSEKDSL